MANPKGTPENLRPIPWAKGQSGNPKGYSKSRRQIDDLLELILDSPGTEREISRVWLANMLEGNFAYLKEYLERRDGKVASSIEISDKPQIDWAALDNECDTPPRKTVNPKGPKPLPASGNTIAPVVSRTLGGVPPGAGQGDDR